MADVITMPKMFDKMSEGIISSWLKRVGDEIKAGDILAEVETNIAVMELESYIDGRLLYVEAAEGEAVPVDGIIAIIGEKGEDISELIKNGYTSKVDNSLSNEPGIIDKKIGSKIKGLKVFISHSHKDVEIATTVIELLRNALNLEPGEIRCTSVDGYRLPAGVTTDEQLKTEIHDSEVLIGLISPSSISSHYVLFELGARWGANVPMIPVITSLQSQDLLKGPLQGINALKAFEEAQLFQLVEDVGTLLGIDIQKASSYHSQVKRLARLCSVVK